MTPDLEQLASRIVYADRLFTAGRFEDSLQVARPLLDAVAAVPGSRGEQWRAELLGLIGRSTLHLGRLDEALPATRDALHSVHALDDEKLNPLLDGFRENLLTILAALEEEGSDAGATGAPAHRALRRAIIRAQQLTDRFRYAQSTETLEPFVARVKSLGEVPAGSPPPEPSDARLWYLPRMLGLLGFNWFHRGDPALAKALTQSAIDASRALGDRTGERIYLANLEWIDQEMATASQP